jgi:hypothetical protein
MSAAALALVDAFSKKPYPGAFPCLDRSKIAFGLTERIADPSLINQGNVGLCTAAAVVFALARTRVVDYVRAVTELYDVGRTTIDKLNLMPCDDLRLYKLPASATIAQVDWIIMASIRDSATWFIDYQSVSDQGGGHGREIADWLKKAGYTDVQGDWNELLNKTAANLKKADYLYSKDYQVLLRIDLDLLSVRLKSSGVIGISCVSREAV